MQKTYYPKVGEIEPQWYLLDAEDMNLGRLAARIARLLMGKDKPEFTPGVDTGDFVIVVNAEKISVTGNRLDDKIYYRHSGFPGGLSMISMRDQLAKHPERVLQTAVKGMLPHNRLSRRLMRKLKIYSGPDHPHGAQQPKALS